MFLPHMPNWIISIKYGLGHWVQWKLCNINTGHIMASSSDGEIIDWSPKEILWIKIIIWICLYC